MKITLIELDLQYSTVTYQSALTSISDSFLLSEVVTMQQINSTAYRLKPRSFYKVHISLSPFCKLLPLV